MLNALDMYKKSLFIFVDTFDKKQIFGYFAP